MRPLPFCALLLACAGISVVDARPSRSALPDDAQPAALDEVLRRAGDWVRRFADDMAYVVADERYEQEYRVKQGSSWNVERRSLLSEIVLVRTPDEEQRAGYPWVQFRDVIEADGSPVPDHRGRLQRLFEQAGTSGYAQASALIQESARFNIGSRARTVNVPCFALFFLHPDNQRRFRFKRTDDAIEYRERQRPTMIRSEEDHRDLPATGLFWIDPASGRVLKTRLVVEVGRHWTMTTEVVYGQDTGVDAWVPRTMREHFGDAATLDCTAGYSNYRRFRTSGRLIVK